MKIKICGLKSQQDIEYVNVLKPDYVGFILAPSKRRISPEKCKELVQQLNKDIIKVGVFVNASAKEINSVMEYANLDVAQIHGEESPEECVKIKKHVWKGFRIKDDKSLEQLNNYKVDGWLLDAYSKDKHGGTGERFTWDLIKNITLPDMVILAGGININNMGEAMKLPGIKCIDVSSGVEINGNKDYKKMKQLIERVRQYE